MIYNIVGHVADYTAMRKYHSAISTRNNSALTRVEVLVVIAMVALMAALLFGVLIPNALHPSPRLMDMVNLRQIGITMHAYAAENDDHISPHPRYLAPFFPESLSQRNLFMSPYQDEDAVLNRGEPSGTGFRYGGYVFLNLGLDLDDIENPSELILVYTAKVIPEQTTRNILFADGHVVRWEEDALRAALPEDVDVDALDGP